MNCAEAFSTLSTQLAEYYSDPGEGRSVARIVMEDALHVYPPFQSGYILSQDQLACYERIAKRLLDGEPVQYVLGEADFFGLKFGVGPAVLIPRPETEELVYAAVQWLKSRKNTMDSIRVLDVGTGSGCIAITLKVKCPWAVCTAIDLSDAALDLARKNAIRHDVEVQFIEMDFLDEQNWQTLPSFDLILSNPPYIPESEYAELAPRVREFEPGTALFVPDHDPLRFYRTLSTFAKQKLSPAGALAAECHAGYAHDAEALWRQAGWSNVCLEKDLSGRPRMLWAGKTLQ